MRSRMEDQGTRLKSVCAKSAHCTLLAVPRALRNYAGAVPLDSFLCGMVVNLSRRRRRSLGRFRRAVTKERGGGGGGSGK